MEDVAEIFNTPLTGAYNWDYTVADNRIKKLYELGKELNWNGSMDLNWEYTHPADERIMQADEDNHALTITLLDKQHTIACPKGEEHALLDAADKLNEELLHLKQTSLRCNQVLI